MHLGRNFFSEFTNPIWWMYTLKNVYISTTVRVSNFWQNFALSFVQKRHSKDVLSQWQSKLRSATVCNQPRRYIQKLTCHNIMGSYANYGWYSIYRPRRDARLRWRYLKDIRNGHYLISHDYQFALSRSYLENVKFAWSRWAQTHF